MRRLIIAFALAGCTAGPSGQYSAADSTTTVPKFAAAVNAVGMDVGAMNTPNSQRALITIGAIKDGVTQIFVRPVEQPERAVAIEIIVAGIRMGAVQYDRSDYPLNKDFLIAVEGWEWMEARINPNPAPAWPQGAPDPTSRSTNEPNPDDPANPHGPGNPGI